MKVDRRVKPEFGRSDTAITLTGQVLASFGTGVVRSIDCCKRANARISSFILNTQCHTVVVCLHIAYSS